MVKWFWAILALASVVSKFRVTDIWYGISLFFGGYTKVDQDHMSCNFASHQTKNIHSRLVGKRPSGNVEKAPSPPQVAPLCGRLPLCGENYVKIILQPHKFAKTGRTRHMKTAVLRTNSKTAKYFSTDTPITETDRALSFQQVLAYIVEGPEPCLWNDRAEPKNTKTDNCKQREPKTRMLP